MWRTLEYEYYIADEQGAEVCVHQPEPQKCKCARAAKSGKKAGERAAGMPRAPAAARPSLGRLVAPSSRAKH